LCKYHSVETADTSKINRERVARKSKERIALAVIFFADGCTFGIWAAHIPQIQQTLGLQAGGLAIALFGLVGGAMIAMPTAGAIVARIGSSRLTNFGAIVSLAALAAPGAATSLFWLVAGTFIFGLTRGLLEVAMNANAIALQRDIGRPILSSFHGCFSLGGFAGAGIGALELALGGTTFEHLAAVGLGLALVAAVAGRSVYEDRVVAAGEMSKLSRRRVVTPALLALGVAAFCVLLGEGALTDWSAVFLRTVIGVTVTAAATGYAAFSLAMMAGRFAGDRIVHALGPRTVVAYGSLTAAGGMALLLILPSYWTTIAGFTLVGIGLSNAVPVIFGAAGDEVPDGVGVATVSTLGYAGFLAGPPLIGGIAQFAGLRVGLSIVALACSLAAIAGLRYIRRAENR